MNLEVITIVSFLIQLAIFIAFFILVADVRAIKKKIGATNFFNRKDLLRALEKAKFMDNNDEVISLYKELAYLEVNLPNDPLESDRLKKLEYIEQELKKNGSDAPSGLSENIAKIKSRLEKKK